MQLVFTHGFFDACISVLYSWYNLAKFSNDLQLRMTDYECLKGSGLLSFLFGKRKANLGDLIPDLRIIANECFDTPISIPAR